MMVSVSNIVKIGALIGAGIIFLKLGGASGIGSKIGGGFTSFGEAFSGSLFPNVFAGGGQDLSGTDNNRIGPDVRTGTEGFDPVGNLTGNLKGLQNILDLFSNFITGQGGDPFQSKIVDQRARSLVFEGPAPFTQTVGGRTAFVEDQNIKQFAFRPLAFGKPTTKLTIGDGSRIRSVTPLTASRLLERGFREV